MIAASERDDDDDWRLERALGERRAILIEELKKIPMAAGGSERRFLCAADPRRLTAREESRLAMLAWKYRRSLPGFLRPRLNPTDPLVMEMGHA